MNPQSLSVLNQLFAGERVGTDKTAVGPFDDTSVLLLRILVEHGNELRARSGADQVQYLRQQFSSARAVPETIERDRATRAANIANSAPPGVPASSLSTSSGDGLASSPPAWRLWRVRCQNIRGVAPPGDTFEFPFDGRCNLIFGRNGSGKSSLLSALVWALTGRVVSDSDANEEYASVYRVPTSEGKGSTICNWPIIVTLPEVGIPNAMNATCWAAVELRGLGDHILWIRRTYPDKLETSEDGTVWRECSGLAHFGIGPLDLQLSLLAPTVSRSLRRAGIARPPR